MKNVKSEPRIALSSLAIRIFDANALKKIILSKPDATDEVKSVLTVKHISAEKVLQLETFSKDNKAYHRNIKNVNEIELNALFSGYSQINVVSTVGDVQYMRSKSGKETLIGENKVNEKLNNGNFEIAEKSLNNKVKQYILSGNEDFLKKLGVSDENGRVRDKMQAKFRQINKFIEHIESVKDKLPRDEINIYDLCCGKSYLSFAVYHYFKCILGMRVNMICVDLKADVIEYCSNLAKRIGFDSMEFVCGDIMAYEMKLKPHLVISLHACDIATDIVLNKASENGADVILSTPCCHHELNHKLNCDTLAFVSKHSMLRQKMCDALTDALRLLKLESLGYKVDALELIDPEDTPKNIMLRAIKKKKLDKEKLNQLKNEYEQTRRFLLGEQ
ncbi:MAG: SAM-dependent methyltransferase [Ruminococcaceae bacterium]|nr:SAM-dependent methyltransferase [Oscillospiraceae bacterium]